MNEPIQSPTKASVPSISPRLRVLLMLLGVSVLIGIGAAYFASRSSVGQQGDTSTLAQGQTKPAGGNASSTSGSADGSFSYDAWLTKYFEGYVSYDVQATTSPDGVYDALLGTDAKGVVHTVVFVKVVSKPAGSDWTVYAGFKPGTDAGAGPYIAFNAKTHEMNILRKFTNYVDTWYPDLKRVSPDGTKYLSAHNRAGDPDDTRTLYVVDILTGSSTVIQQLPKEETYIETKVTFGDGEVSYLSWLDAHTIAAKVFDPAKTLNEVGIPHPLLRVETIMYP